MDPSSTPSEEVPLRALKEIALRKQAAELIADDIEHGEEFKSADVEHGKELKTADVEHEIPFFDCKKDLEGSSKEIFITEQNSKDSTCMKIILQLVETPKEKGPQYYRQSDGLVVMRLKPDSQGRIVVPESLRAYVLKMHHNVQLAGHQGYKRMLTQIRDLFFWPGLKRDVIK